MQYTKEKTIWKSLSHSRCLEDGTGETVSHVRRVVGSGIGRSREIRSLLVGSRVVDSRCPVVLLSSAFLGSQSCSVCEDAHESVSTLGVGPGTEGAIVDHAFDLFLGAFALRNVLAVVGSVVILHQSWVENTIVGDGVANMDASVGFLENGRENVALVNLGAVGLFEDSIVEEGSLLLGVQGRGLVVVSCVGESRARLFDVVQVGGPDLIEADPLVDSRPVAAITVQNSTAAGGCRS